MKLLQPVCVSLQLIESIMENTLISQLCTKFPDGKLVCISVTIVVCHLYSDACLHILSSGIPNKRFFEGMNTPFRLELDASAVDVDFSGLSCESSVKS